MPKTSKEKQKYYQTISERLRKAVEYSGKSQSEIISIAKERHYSLQQSTLSKMLSESGNSISLNNVVELSNILELDLNKVLSTDPLAIFNPPQKTMSDSSSLIYRADNSQMRGYLSDFYTYFFPTKSTDDNFLNGLLSFKASPDYSKCLAYFTLYTGQQYTEGEHAGEEIKKEYMGELILSPSLGVCYCILKNEEIGEISFIMFRYIRILNEKLVCRNALAITPCAGDHRMPTAHRMIFSKTELNDTDLSYLQGQLYLNESNILISKNGLDALMKNRSKDLKTLREYSEYNPNEKNISSDFMGIRPSMYYKFDESIIRSAFIDKETKMKAINLLREYSESPRYNKIGDKCDEIIYEYIVQKTSKKDN